MITKAQVLAAADAAGAIDSIYSEDIDARAAVFAAYRKSNPCPVCKGTGANPTAPFAPSRMFSDPEQECLSCEGYGIEFNA